jgi:positive regulator of sigma E activity
LRWFAGPSATSIEIPDHTDDRQPLNPGESVTLSVPDGEILRAAATIYLPLLAGLLFGALAGRTIAGYGEFGTLIAAATGTGAGWVVARLWSRRRPPRIGVRRAPGGR